MAEDRRQGSGARNRLEDLGQRIHAARAARTPRRGRAGEEYTAGSVAWRMVTELVVGVLVGGAMGWGLDSLFGTMPIFLIIMGLFGFAAGVRTMMRSADEIRAAQAGEDAAPGGADKGGERTGPSAGRPDAGDGTPD